MKKGLLELAEREDVVVLAQASMARVLNSVPADELKVPVLTSPELAVKQIREALCSSLERSTVTASV